MTTKMAAPDRPMTERKMEPWMLRDLADIFERGEASSDSESLREEAARREAEAARKAQRLNEPMPAFESFVARREAGAAKPDEWQTMRGHVPLIRCPGGVNTCTGYDCLTAGCKRGERGIPQGERQGPDSAAAIQPFDPDMLMRWEMRPVGSDETRREHYLAVTGFTLADVRRLAETVHGIGPNFRACNPDLLKPFLPLLKEPRDGE